MEKYKFNLIINNHREICGKLDFIKELKINKFKNSYDSDNNVIWEIGEVLE